MIVTRHRQSLRRSDQSDYTSDLVLKMVKLCVILLFVAIASVSTMPLDSEGDVVDPMTNSNGDEEICHETDNDEVNPEQQTENAHYEEVHSRVRRASPYQEAPCAKVGGVCKFVTDCHGGYTTAGLCPKQPNNIKCCRTTPTSPGSGSICVTMSPSNFEGARLRVHRGFVAAINRINNYAVQAGVRIHVTSSYRKKPVSGGATTSNHMAGHAIDMNVRYDGKLCNSQCLGQASKPSKVAQFINKVRQDSGLRWGGDFSKRDPVHIDDGLNRNMAEWRRIYAEAQRNC